MTPKYEAICIISTPSESLWALDTDGVLWQINPLNHRAAPVMNIDELSSGERQKLRRQVLQCWSRFAGPALQEERREAVPAF